MWNKSGNLIFVCLVFICLVFILFGCSRQKEAETISLSPPSIPSAVIAIARNGGVSIFWAGDYIASSYNIYWSTTPGVTKQAGTKISGASNGYTHTGRTNGITYYYVVTAKNMYGESSESAEVSATPYDYYGAWTISSLGLGNNIGTVETYPSTAIDSNNKAHISYYDSSNYALKYISNASGSWETSTVDNIGGIGAYSSIAIDSNNKAHISYYDSANKYLKYATNASGSWETSTVDNIGGVGAYSSIAIDSNNKVHIIYHDGYYDYYDSESHDVTSIYKYSTNASGLWATSIIDTGGYYHDEGIEESEPLIFYQGFPLIAIDSNNKVHTCYYDNTSNYDFKCATNSSGSWGTSTVDNTGNVGVYPAIAIDSNNKVHILYYDSSNKDFKYATNASGSL